MSIKNGLVVSASTSLGSLWRAEEVRKAASYPRRLSHLFVLGLALPPLTVIGAQAHQSPAPHHRIVLDSTAPVRPETIKDIPPDAPIPPPAPAPAPTPKPAPPKPRYVFYGTGPIVDIIRAAAARYGVDPNQLLRVAMCESGLNPHAYNSRPGATRLVPFKPATFYGHSGHNIWDPTHQPHTA